MAISLENKVVAITGASSGIGAATATAIANKYGSRGVKIVISARRIDRLEALAKVLRGTGAEVEVVSCDVAKKSQVDALVQTCINKFGRLDVMFANAGYGLTGSVIDLTDAQCDDLINVNVKGTLYAMQAAAKVMLTQRSGHIIATSSAAARRGLPLYGIYSATKAAQLSLAEALRVELRHQLLQTAGNGGGGGGGDHIYVSTVHPATTETEFFDTAAKVSGIPSSGMGRSQTAAQVGAKILKLMEHPRPELWPMPFTHLGLSLATIFNKSTDNAMLKMLPRRLKNR